MSKQTRTGDYNRRLNIHQQTPGTSPNADGQVPEAQEIVTRRWAKRRAIRGREKFGDRQIEADVTYLVWVRFDNWTSTITPEMWLRFNDGVRLNIIRAFDPDDRQREILMECKNRVGDD